MSKPTTRHARAGAAADGAGRARLRLWLRLLASTNLIERHLRARFRSEFGVTLPQFDVLSELERAGRPQTMSEVSRGLMVSNGNVTGVVDRLVREGLVRRWTSSDDRRVQLIGLTAKGRRSFSRMASRHASWIGELLAGLPTHDLEHISGRVRDVRETIKANLSRSARP